MKKKEKDKKKVENEKKDEKIIYTLDNNPENVKKEMTDEEKEELRHRREARNANLETLAMFLFVVMAGVAAFFAQIYVGFLALGVGTILFFIFVRYARKSSLLNHLLYEKGSLIIFILAIVFFVVGFITLLMTKSGTITPNI